MEPNSQQVTAQPTTLPIHPAADAFPMLDGDAFDALVQDIKAHGLRESVVRLDGQVLDGRNRLRACTLLGIEPRFIDLTTAEVGDPLDYVASLNLHRRHLQPHQRGEILLRLVEAKGGAVGQHKGGRPSKEKPSHSETVSKVAKDLGIPKATAHRQVKAAEAARAKAEGKPVATRAPKQQDPEQPRRKQRPYLPNGTPNQRKPAKCDLRRAWEWLGTITSAKTSCELVSVAAIVSEEPLRLEWVENIDAAMRAMRDLRKQIEEAQR